MFQQLIEYLQRWFKQLIEYYCCVYKEETPTPLTAARRVAEEAFSGGATRKPDRKQPKTTTFRFPEKRAKRGYIFWGGSFIDIDDLQDHLMLIGSIGSGKTILLQIILRTVLQAIRPGSDVRAVIIDAKGDSMGIVSKSGVPYRFINVLDIRAEDWLIGKDIGGDYAIGNAVAHALIPFAKNQEFWDRVGIQVLQATIQTLIYVCGEEFDLADLVNVCRLPLEEFIIFLEQCPYTAGVVNQYLKSGSPNMVSGIMATLSSEIGQLQIAAAHSKRAKGKVSIREFLQKEEVIILSLDEKSPEVGRRHMQAFFKVLSQLVSGSPDDRHKRTFIFLDELRLISNMPGIVEFLVFSRSKGGRVVAATQTHAGIEEVFGKETAEDIFGVCLKGFLRILGDTADWAAKLFGSIELKDEVLNTNEGKDNSTGSNVNRYIRNTVLDSDFLSIKKTSPENGLTGIFQRENDSVHLTIAWGVIEDLLPESDNTPGIIRKDPKDMMLEPWSQAEKEKFIYGKQKGKDNKYTEEGDDDDDDDDDSLEPTTWKELLALIVTEEWIKIVKDTVDTFKKENSDNG